jgi:hypothetical protein
MTRLFKSTRPVRRATQLEVILHTWKHVSGHHGLLACANVQQNFAQHTSAATWGATSATLTACKCVTPVVGVLNIVSHQQNQVCVFVLYAVCIYHSNPNLCHTASSSVLSMQHCCCVLQSGSAAVLELTGQQETSYYLAGPGSTTPFAYHVAWISALISHRKW